jgi:hypothetical protein
MNGNEYAKKLKEQFGIMMLAFPTLSEEDIDAIVEYINSTRKDLSSPAPAFAINPIVH